MAEAETGAQEPEAAVEEKLGVDDFTELLSKEFKPKSDRAKESVERAVRTLAEQALQETTVISTDVVATINSIIAEIDAKLTEQVNLILHHPEFQQVEGTWRGLHYLVNNTETDEMLKIKVCIYLRGT